MKNLMIENDELDQLLCIELNKLKIQYKRQVFEDIYDGKSINKKYFSQIYFSESDQDLVNEVYSNVKYEYNSSVENVDCKFNMLPIVLSGLINPLAAIIMIASNYHQRKTFVRMIMCLIFIPIYIIIIMITNYYDYLPMFTFLQFGIHIISFWVISLLASEFYAATSLSKTGTVILINFVSVIVVFLIIFSFSNIDYQAYKKYSMSNNGNVKIYYENNKFNSEDIQYIENIENEIRKKFAPVFDSIILEKGEITKVTFVVDNYSFNSAAIMTILKTIRNRINDRFNEFTDIKIGRIKYWFIQTQKI